MKCCTVVAGACNAAFLNELLDHIEVNWGERPIPRTQVARHSLYVRQAIEIDGYPWQIQEIATDHNCVALHDEDTGDMVTRSITFVSANTM